MMDVAPALIMAARRKAHRRYLPVLVELHPSLDYTDYRKPPVPTVARNLHVSERTVYRLIGTLRRIGYLESGPRLGNASTVRLSIPTPKAA